MSEHDQKRREAAADYVREVFPEEVAAAVIGENEEGDAFGAVAWHLHQAEEAGHDPLAVLAAIEEEDVAWSVNANNPAAFIASKIDY
ncbi:hypothetical protein [Amycolatopsis keratiniphila]|uniref:Uncharacterized protein n=1 Tax=Amycolatopsis keratiniphila subsp. keratiniphila TaxID=227715 RepID=A0A1W2M217_9PSEU|nr:hypothetical protein [Amycolatopsis keratiniphila]ONF73933.1 hypothetical protein AVR91_0204170 [Amycolatopsis keratiniphila subsp. keratiniphila]